MDKAPVIPLCVPSLTGREQHYINEALRDNWVSYVGPHVTLFEQRLAAAAGARYAVAMNSGTSALHIALILAGVTPESEVLMPAVSFVAPANAIRYCGAWPIFSDVRQDDWQMDLAKATAFLEKGCERVGTNLINRRTRRPVKALLLVHLLGGMGDVDGFARLAEKHNLFLIEDAAECLGAAYRGREIGAPCSFLPPDKRFVITSFNGNKIITTGGGGALFTESEQIARQARHLSTTAKADPIEFFHDTVGYNYRLTNLAAAFGLGQLEVLNDFVECKRRIAAAYETGLRGLTEVSQCHPESRDTKSTFWMYTILLNRPARPLIHRLIERGVQARPIWQLLPSLPAFEQKADCWEIGIAETLCERGLSLPCSVGLEVSAQQEVLAALLSEVTP